MKACLCLALWCLLHLSAFPQQDTVSVSSASPASLEYLAPGDFNRVAGFLKDNGLEAPFVSFLAIGYNNGAKELSVFYKDSTGAQKQRVLAMDPEAFSRLTAEPVPQPTPVAAAPKAAKLDQSGRIYFMTHTTLKTFNLYIMGLDKAFPSVDESVRGGMALLIGGSSIYGSYLFTKKRELGYGRVAMMNYGGEMLGFYYPLLSGGLLHNATNIDWKRKRWDPFAAEYYYETGGPSDKTAAWMSMIGFPAGIYIGSKVKFAENDHYGNASIMTDMSRWAFLYGFLLPMYGEGGTVEDYWAASCGLTMALLPAGFYLGCRLVGDRDYSSGRSFMVTEGGVMGALTGLFIPTLFEKKGFFMDRRVYATTTLAGHMLGTWFGFRFKPSTEYTLGQGIFTALSAAGGAGVAMSIPLITKSDDHRFFVGMALPGAWGGFFLGERLARSIFEVSDKDRRVSGVSFPVLYQWPLLLAASRLHGAQADSARVQTVDLIRVNF